MFHESMATGLPVGGHHHHGAPIIRPGQVKVDSVVENAPNKHLCIFNFFQSCAKLTKIAIVRLSQKTSLVWGWFGDSALFSWNSDPLTIWVYSLRTARTTWDNGWLQMLTRLQHQVNNLIYLNKMLTSLQGKVSTGCHLFKSAAWIEQSCLH